MMIGNSAIGITLEKACQEYRYINLKIYELENKLVDSVNSFLLEISNYWYCPETVDYFQKEFKPTFDGLNEQMVKSFRELFTIFGNSIKTWSITTGGNAVIDIFSAKCLSIDVGVIKSQKDGKYAIDPVNAERVTKEYFKKIRDNFNQHILQMQNSPLVKVFLGGDQQAIIRKALLDITNALGVMLDNFSQQINKKVNETAEKYRKTAAKVAGDFSNIRTSIINKFQNAVDKALTMNNNTTNNIGSAFQDGYQFGDVTKTAGNVVKSVSENAKSEFQDGYQFGDITKAATSTIKDIAQLFTKNDDK